MDVQHRRLFSFINDLQRALEAGRPRKVLLGILDELVQFLYIHFADEEQFMESNGYPELPEHADVHRKFHRQVSELQKRVRANGSGPDESDVASIARWLKDHLLVTDQKYGEYFALGGQTILPR